MADFSFLYKNEIDTYTISEYDINHLKEFISSFDIKLTDIIIKVDKHTHGGIFNYHLKSIEKLKDIHLTDKTTPFNFFKEEGIYWGGAFYEDKKKFLRGGHMIGFNPEKTLTVDGKTSIFISNLIKYRNTEYLYDYCKLVETRDDLALVISPDLLEKESEKKMYLNKNIHFFPDKCISSTEKFIFSHCSAKYYGVFVLDKDKKIIVYRNISSKEQHENVIEHLSSNLKVPLLERDFYNMLGKDGTLSKDKSVDAIIKYSYFQVLEDFKTQYLFSEYEEKCDI